MQNIIFIKLYQSLKRYSVQFLCMHSKWFIFCLKQGVGLKSCL
jgi:hypothetical protein